MSSKHPHATATEKTDLQSWYSLRMARLARLRWYLFLFLLCLSASSALQLDPPSWLFTFGPIGCPIQYPRPSEELFGLRHATGWLMAYLARCVPASLGLSFLLTWGDDLPSVEECHIWEINANYARKAVENSSTLVLVAVFVLKQVYRVGAAIAAQRFMWTLYLVFAHEDPVTFEEPASERTIWETRLQVAICMVTAAILGPYLVQNLEDLQLARIDRLESGLLILPALTIFHLHCASESQWIYAKYFRTRAERLGGRAPSRQGGRDFWPLIEA